MNDNCVMTHRVDPDRPRRAADGLYLCAGHQGELEQLIAEMPVRADDLGRAAGASGPRPPGSHSELSVDEPAARHRAHMAGVVASWCRVVAEDHHITPPRSAGLADTCPWLIPHLGWCAANRWVDEMLLELRKATGKALGLVDIRAHRVPLGVQCFVHRDGERCTGTVTLVVRADDWLARCDHPDCTEPQRDVTPYLRSVRKGCGVTEEDVTIMAARFGVAVNGDVLRQWRHRGNVTAQVIAGVVWYDLASVTVYLARRKAQRERLAS